MKNSQLLFLTLLVGSLWSYAEPIQTIGIPTADVTAVPVVTLNITMQTAGQIWLLDNPRIGVHKCTMPEEAQIRRPNPIKVVWMPPRPFSDLNHFTLDLTITDPNIIDFAGTGRSFGFGISGKWSMATITVNDREYKFKPIVDMQDLALFMATWNPEGESASAKPALIPATVKKYWINGASKIYHTQESCRYVTESSNTVTNIDGLRKCKVCESIESR